MSSKIAIKVENLSKSYRIYNAPVDRLKQFLLPRLHPLVGLTPSQYYTDFWALKDVSFEVEKGETVGIIGRNGCGKSTLLQVICGTLNPTVGSVSTHGRIAALLELGSGFNPEFTGKDNIYLSGSILGLDKQEIDDRFDEIASFADIGEFINQPVKCYSSGMFVRLAFSVNVISSPDIMIVDEALAVGDMNFQAKCMAALTRFQDNGGTVLFVSHDVGAVKSLCRQAIYLDQGQVINSGPAPEIADHYVRNMREEMSRDSAQLRNSSTTSTRHTFKTPSDPSTSQNANGCELASSAIDKTSAEACDFKSSEQFDHQVAPFRYGIGGALIRYVELLDLSDQLLIAASFNQPVKIRIYFEVIQEADLSVNYYVKDEKRNLIFGAGLPTVGVPLLHCSAGSRWIATYTTRLPLQEGSYSLQVQLTRPLVPDETADFLDVIENAFIFKVERRQPGRIWAKVYLDNEFTILTV